MMNYQDIDDLWVFGYGSLMWRPGFEYIEKAPAICSGYHRSFCIYSYVYRGTPEDPGLVLGLDKGGETIGMAFRLCPKKKNDVMAYLQEREQVTSVYNEVIAPIEVEGHGAVMGVFYVAKQGHKQHNGAMSIAEQAKMIAFTSGQAGACCDYLFNTCKALQALNIFDAELAELSDKVKKLQED